MVPTAAPVAVETNSRRVTPCACFCSLIGTVPRAAGLLDGGCGDDLDDGPEPRGLRAALRIEIAGGSAPRIVLDRHARREGHRLFSEAADVELMDARRLVDQLAPLLEDRLVVVD